MLVHTTTIHC